MTAPPGPHPFGPKPPLGVALDLDGTLLWNGTLGEANRRAVATLRHHGVRVVIATGKHPLALWPYAIALDLPDGPHIGLSGACLTTDRGRTQTLLARLEPPDVRAVCELLRALGLPFAVFATDAIRIDRTSGTVAGALALQERLEAVGEPTVLCADPLPPHATVGKVLTLLPDSDPREQTLQQRLPASVHPLRSGPWFYDLGPAGHTKGSALARIAQDVGLPLERFWAMGDSENDIALLAATGLAVSFEGGPATLLAHADLVVPPGPDAVATAMAGLLPQWFSAPA